MEPDYKLAGIFLGAGILLDTIPHVQLTIDPLVTLLGIIFAVQATCIRFTFDHDAFELKMGEDLRSQRYEY